MSQIKLKGSPFGVLLAFSKTQMSVGAIIDLLGCDPSLSEIRARLVDVSIDLASISGDVADLLIPID